MKDNSKYSILIVDDDSDIREMIALLLSKAGYTYNTATNGDEALAMCTKTPFDLILLDIMMPGSDGYDFCEKLRKNNQRCYIIFITALDEPDALEKALFTGGDDFLRKPFEPRELLARIVSCLRRLTPPDTPTKHQQNLNPISLNCGSQFIPERNTIVTQRGELHFTPTETGLLYMLISNPGRKFTYAELYENVWKTNYLNDKGTVATFISAIKKKLKDGKVSVNIETIWGEGYYYEANKADFQ